MSTCYDCGQNECDCAPAHALSYGDQIAALIATAEARGRAGAIADLRARYEESEGLLMGFAAAAAYLEAKGHQP